MRTLLVEKKSEMLSIRRYFTPSSNNTLDSSLGVEAEFESTNSLSKAFSEFKSFHPDIIIIDLPAKLDEVIDFCVKVRAYESTRHTGIIVIQGASLLTNDAAGRCLEAGADDFIDSKARPREVSARVHTVFRFKAVNDELRAANHRLLVQSLTDDLTGLHNMRSFKKEYEQILNRSQAKNSGFGVMMLDLDRFKSVNDSTNHLVGSFVISEVGRIITESCAELPEVIPARYGGDEFIIAMTADQPQKMMTLGEAICEKVRNRVFQFDGSSIELTVSVGFSWVPGAFDGEENIPIKAADMMLYRSKNLGRDQVRGMMLRNAVDFDHVSRFHLVNGNTRSDDNQVPRIRNVKFF